MKKYIYSLLLNILIFSVVLNVFTGITISKDIIYALGTYASFAVAIMLYRPFLRFLTVKINFLTFWLSASILLIGAFYLLDSIMPGFEVKDTIMSSVDLGFMNIASFEMNKVLTIVFSSIFGGLLSSVMHSLNGNDE